MASKSLISVLKIDANDLVFAFVANADTFIIAGISNGNDANTLLGAVASTKLDTEHKKK